MKGEEAFAQARTHNLLRLRYQDDGMGMEPAVASRVFEPFFTTKRGTGGTGLGMHIVYNLVSQAMGGRIRVDTAPGKGVRIDIVFPQRDPRARSAMALTG
jgi:signal transduction histidine kinase